MLLHKGNAALESVHLRLQRYLAGFRVHARRYRWRDLLLQGSLPCHWCGLGLHHRGSARIHGHGCCLGQRACFRIQAHGLRGGQLLLEQLWSRLGYKFRASARPTLALGHRASSGGGVSLDCGSIDLLLSLHHCLRRGADIAVVICIKCGFLTHVIRRARMIGWHA